MKILTVRDFFESKNREFALSVITEPHTLDNNIQESQLHRPGLALTGYLERFAYKRIQILGETEISYMQTIDDKTLYDRVKEMFEFNIPLIIATKGLSIPQQVEFLANDMNIAIMTSRLSTDKLIVGLTRFLREYFAPQKSMHGTLVEAFGVGMLLTGKSGIGKSECALDLVERGHRMIADDIVKIIQTDDTLTGTSVNDFGYFMEVRGVGLIDVERMFGIEAVRKKTVIDTQVELLLWQDNLDYERIGLTNNYVEILGVNIPIIYLPVSPGKNVSVILEVIALNHILKNYGYEAAEVYQRKLQESIQRKSGLKKINETEEES
ncbi:MAG: HPr(Ser) kinase/phosphatase [Candidatus Cloacimonetes bacterium]|nr:HPr(Ser) kinase/phosphatase [Candidatus Cloacimonadota bacterium]